MTALQSIINDLLFSEIYFLDGIQRGFPYHTMIEAASQWGERFERALEETMSIVEPCLRQSIFMTLLPAAAFDDRDPRPYVDIIAEHLANIGVSLTDDQTAILVTTCVNINKLKGLSSRVARNRCNTIADVRSDAILFDQIVNRQGRRCVWCGISLFDPTVRMTLEHVVPKHIGDDVPDASNWAIACQCCNFGKSDALAWSSRPEAHDFMSRKAFGRPEEITPAHRWAVLRRSRECRKCKKTAIDVELGVTKVIKTGLPIPSNCHVVCVNCAEKEQVNLLKVAWDDEETLKRGLDVVWDS